jgi:hypothetical protein
MLVSSAPAVSLRPSYRGIAEAEGMEAGKPWMNRRMAAAESARGSAVVQRIAKRA